MKWPRAPRLSAVCSDVLTCWPVFPLGPPTVSGLWAAETEEAGLPGHLQRGDHPGCQGNSPTGTLGSAVLSWSAVEFSECGTRMSVTQRTVMTGINLY